MASPKVQPTAAPTSRTFPTCLAMNDRLAKYWRWGERWASMENGTLIWPNVNFQVLLGWYMIYASSILMLPSSDRSISALYRITGMIVPSNAMRALRISKRPLPISGIHHIPNKVYRTPGCYGTLPLRIKTAYIQFLI